MVGSGGFFAVCRECGADAFPNRLVLREAIDDALGHGVLDHVYAVSQLERHELTVRELGS